MKYISSLILAGLLFFSANAADKKATLTVKTSIACDHCLQCSSCGQNINDRIRDIEKGIRKVKVDPKANTITVTYLSDKTNPAQIKKAIAAAGFDADEVKATADAYEKLDGCCKAK